MVRDKVLLAMELVVISGLIAVGVLLSPWILWTWLTEPREWRKPKDVGHGLYEHP